MSWSTPLMRRARLVVAGLLAVAALAAVSASVIAARAEGQHSGVVIGLILLDLGPGEWTRVELGFQPIKISSFGEDRNGDMYIVDLQGGVIYRIESGTLP